MLINNDKQQLRFYQVDAFSSKAFRGNPGGVCLGDVFTEEAVMQSIAAEINVSETAFVAPVGNKEFTNTKHYFIRWFTPICEMPLCGHATLSAAKVLFDEIKIPYNDILFHSKSGILKVKKEDKMITMTFLADHVIQIKGDKMIAFLQALGIQECVEIVKGVSTRKVIIRVNNPKEVLQLKPNFQALMKINDDGIKGVAVTAGPFKGYDFISRYFNPWAGVKEDPVTGSVHTLLVPYWGDILNKVLLKAYQVSSRGGSITGIIRKDNRIDIKGRGIVVMKGHIIV